MRWAASITLCAGLALLAGPAMAQEPDSADRPGLEIQNPDLIQEGSTVQDQDTERNGTQILYDETSEESTRFDSQTRSTMPGGMSSQDRMHGGITSSGYSDMDRRALDDIYTYHSRSFHETMGARDYYRTHNDPGREGLASRLMIEDLIMASRLRQRYRAMGMSAPDWTGQTAQIDYSSPDWMERNMASRHQYLERMRQAHSSIQDPELRSLAQRSEETLTHQTGYGDFRSTPTMTLTITEQVAGFREETGDAGLLSQFHRAQMKEAKDLRAQAQTLRTAGNGQLADHFIKMAEDHERNAEKAANLMRDRKFNMAPANHTASGHEQHEMKANDIIMHMWRHHNEALTHLGHSYLRATDPAVKQLFDEAMRGTTQHMEILMPHVEQIDED